MFDPSQLKRIRQRLGLTQTALARETGVSQSLVTKIETGSIDPKWSTVQRLQDGIARLETQSSKTVASVLHRDVVAAAATERIAHLIKRMQRSEISQVPVLDGKHVIGLLTERTILAAMSAGKDLSTFTAADLMTDAPPVVPATTPLIAVARLLEHVEIVIVRDRERIAGVVTRSDLLRTAV